MTTLRGNVSPIVLDVKYNDGSGDTCVYGNVYVDPGIRLVYDMHPWASEFYQYAGETEMITDWPDPNYKQSPEGMWHDWNGMEGEIVIFNFSELLSAENGEDIVDVRVRATDNTPMSYMGNWRRSDNVLDQVCLNLNIIRNSSRNTAGTFCGYDTEASFIGNNPYDRITTSNPADHLKRMHYDGNTTAVDTSFIALRDLNGNANLDYYIAVQITDHTLIESFPEEIEMIFYSSEKNIPQSMKDPGFTYLNHASAIKTKAKRCSPLPPDVTEQVKDRIFSLLFNSNRIRNECLLYHVRLKVSDSERSKSDDDDPVLYVSSSDNMWGNDWLSKRDYAKSLDSTSGGFPISGFHFGSSNNIRGVGTGNPDEENKKWYSYDEFITSGGIEIVYAHIEDSNYRPSWRETDDCVAVQSESDIMILCGHGDLIGAIGADFEFPNYNPLPYNGWMEQQRIHAPNGEMRDYGVNNTPEGGLNAWGIDRQGNYWQANPRPSNWRELRWLTIFGCAALNRKLQGVGGSGSVNWKIRITPSSSYTPHLSSVCGFHEDVFAMLLPSFIPSADFHRNPEFAQLYSEKLEWLFADQISQQNPNPYEPSNPCSTPDSALYELWSECVPSCDISVSAWMEAACKILNTSSSGFQKGYMDRKFHTIAAIDHDNHDNIVFYYYLKKKWKKDVGWFERRWDFKIKRTDDFTSDLDLLDPQE